MSRCLMLVVLSCVSVVAGGQDPFGGAAPIAAGVKREKVKAPPSMIRGSEAYRIIEAELYCKTSVHFVDVPLSKAIREISVAHQIPIVIDNRSLANRSIDSDLPVSLILKGVSLRSALRLLLAGEKLDFVIKDEVLQIKTKEDVSREAVVLVYDLDELDERSDDLAGVVLDSLETKYAAPMPKPVVRLVRSDRADGKKLSLFVETNPAMQAHVQSVLKKFKSGAEG